MASLYNQIPIADFNSSGSGYTTNPIWGNGMLAHFTDEGMSNASNQAAKIYPIGSIWKYDQVRNLNNFIIKVPTSSFPESSRNKWLGQAKVMRAYLYFAIVKQYGGVPIIKEVQNFTGDNLEELKVARNTEKEVYDFIAKDLDEAIPLLSGTTIKDGQNGFINQNMAYALKSRAMIYAGSVAKYGTVQLNGLVGIPSTDAPLYYKAAYDAAKAIIGKYTLYDKNADKTLNFTNLFLDTDNPEIIFVRKYKYPQKGHTYDLLCLPHHGVGSSGGWGSRLCPTLEMVESYEYKDGTDGKLKCADNQGKLIEYSNPLDIFKDKDPRLAATVMLPFSDWKGYTIDVRAGIIDGAETIQGTGFETVYKGKYVIGRNGPFGDSETTLTGFYIRKYLQPAYDKSKVTYWTQDQQFIDFRYAEVLLNYAEAAVELGGLYVADAKTAVNEIRSRAGIRQLSDAEVTIDRVRNERNVELAFENHRYWDLRRWRTYDKLFNNYQSSALMPYLVLSNNSYVFKTVKTNYIKTFFPNMYYEEIDKGEISKNSKLIQNPGY